MQARPITGQLAKIASGPRATQDLARIGAGIARGPNLKRLLNAAAWSGTWPVPEATLDLDFANDFGYVRGVGQGRSMDALTFTRPSLARYVDKDGLLKTAYYYHPPSAYQETVATAISPNLFQYSNLFTDANWGKLGATVSVSGEQPPAGFSTCFQVTENSGALNRAALTNTTAGNLFFTGTTFSLYAKEIVGSSKRYLYLGMWSGAETRWCFAIFDIATGNITFRADNFQNSVSGGYIENVGNGWVRVSATISSPLAGQTPAIGLTNDPSPTNAANLGGYTGDGASGMLIAGAQFESGAIVKASPRFDWASVAQVSQVNLAPLSNAFDNSGWVKNTASILPVTVEKGYSDPFGGSNAFLIKEGSGTPSVYLGATELAGHLVFGPSSTPIGVPGYYSIFVKAKERTQVAIGAQWYSGAANGFVLIFDLVSKSLVNTFARGGNVSVSNPVVTELTDGWFRISMILTSAQVSSGLSVGPATSNIANYTGNGTSGLYVYGAQFNLGNSLLDYVETGAQLPTTIPLTATEKCNGLLIEESRTNRLLWGRDATSGTGTNMLLGSNTSVNWNTSNVTVGSFGSELITNGTFDNSSGWTLGTGISVASGNLIFASVAAGVGASTSISALDVNSVYRATFDVSNRSGGSIFTRITRPGQVDVTTTIGANGTYQFNFISPIAGMTSFIFVASGNGGAANGSIDNVSLKKISADNITDPLGGNTAATATATGNNATLTQTISSFAGPHTFSIWMRRKTGTGNIDITCDSAGTWVTQNISSSWARYSVSQTTATATINPGARIVASGDEIEVWGPQLIPGSVLTNYQATTASAVFGWSRSNVTVAFNQTGIDGVVNAATSITATSNNGVLIQPVSLTSGSRTCSVYLKRITGTDPIQISLDGSTWSTTDLSSVQWRRFVLSGTLTNPTLGIRLITSGDAIAMDYGQIEDGTFATTPILTTTASVTRSVELATLSGANFDSWFEYRHGTLIGELGAVYGLSNNGYLTLLGGNASGFTLLRLGVEATSVYINSNIVGGLGGFERPIAQKTGVSYINYSVSFNSNSTKLLTGTIAIIPLVFSSLRFDSGGFGTSSMALKRVVFIPAKVSNESLVQLTS